MRSKWVCPFPPREYGRPETTGADSSVLKALPTRRRPLHVEPWHARCATPCTSIVAYAWLDVWSMPPRNGHERDSEPLCACPPMRLALNRAPMSLPANTSRRMRAARGRQDRPACSPGREPAPSWTRARERGSFGTSSGPESEATGSTVSGAVSGRQMSLFLSPSLYLCMRTRVRSGSGAVPLKAPTTA